MGASGSGTQQGKLTGTMPSTTQRASEHQVCCHVGQRGRDLPENQKGGNTTKHSTLGKSKERSQCKSAGTP